MMEIELIEARSEDEARYTILGRTPLIAFQALSGPKRNSKGPVDYILEDGRDVDPIDDNTFRIVETDEVIYRV